MKNLFFRYISILILFFLFYVNTSFAQPDQNNPYFFSLNYRIGNNKPHRPEIENLTYPYRGVDLKLGWQSIGRQPWQVAYRYPSYGFGINWNTFKTNIIGEPVAAYFFTNFPQITTSFARFDLEVDFGLSYGINPYDSFTNPYNFSTGSSVNVFFGLYLEQSFDIGKQYHLFVCEGFTHYSNGALSYPNLGLNIPNLKFGLRYQPRFAEKINKGSKPKFEKYWCITMPVAGGTKKLFAPTPNYHQVYIAPALYYQPDFKRRIGFGYEIAYNEAIALSRPKNSLPFENKITQAVFVAHEFIIYRFTLNTQFGIYLRNMPSDKFYYERIGLGFYLTPVSRIVLNLKAHYFKAEYVETGMVFDINFK